MSSPLRQIGGTQARETGGRPVGSVTRAIGKMTVKTMKDREAQVASQDAMRLKEEFFEFQIGIAGKANAGVAWQPADCRFPAPMIPAPMQRDSDLEVPQFFFGYHLYNSSAPVVLIAYVESWIQDDSDYTIGANCQIGSYTPNVNDDVEFAGYAHLTFQGYSGPQLEDDNEGA